MKRSLVLRALAALSLLPLALIAAPSSADGPPLSPFCQSRHDNANVALSSTGAITIGAQLNAGEQLYIDNRQTPIEVSATGAQTVPPTTVAQFNVFYYNVETTGQHSLQIKGIPSGSEATIKLDCGIPPTITGVDNATYHVGDNPHDYECHGVTNPDIRTCGGIAPTDTAGSFSYQVTAVDVRGLLTVRTFHVTVVKTDQTLSFTTPNPGTVPLGDTGVQIDARSDKDVTDDFGNHSLPVTISTDPNTPACAINPLAGPFAGNIATLHGGTCTVFADQPGNDAFSPAQRISMTFQIEKKPVVLTAFKANKGFAGLTPTTFKAELKHFVHFGPGQILAGFPGQQITFFVDGKPVCTATTVFQSNGGFDTTAVATCKATIGLQAAITSSTYNATYAGDQDNQGAVATARLWL